jgi:hypothetical protein
VGASRSFAALFRLTHTPLKSYRAPSGAVEGEKLSDFPNPQVGNSATRGWRSKMVRGRISSHESSHPTHRQTDSATRKSRRFSRQNLPPMVARVLAFVSQDRAGPKGFSPTPGPFPKQLKP